MNKSPKPVKEAPKELNFYDALKAIMEGKSVTKKEWGNKEFYGLLVNGRLSLHKPDGKDYDWVLTDGDIYGEDFILV